jgi:hypothetical protein
VSSGALCGEKEPRLYMWMLLILCIFAAAGADHFSNKEGQICRNESFCFPETFTATHEFTVIQPEQLIPPGLHIRLNLTSGLKEGKLMPVPVANDSGSDLVLSDQSQKVNESSEQDVTISDISQDSTLSLEERTSLSLLLKDDQTILQNLEFLEEISHDVDVGEELTVNFNSIFLLLDHENDTVKEHVLLIIGNSVSNNYKALNNLIKSTPVLFPKLTSLLKNESVTISVEKRCFYAFSCMIRGLGIMFFKDYDGFSLLKQLYVDKPRLEFKILQLMSDLMDANMSTELSTTDSLNLVDMDFWCLVLENSKDLETFIHHKCP